MAKTKVVAELDGNLYLVKEPLRFNNRRYTIGDTMRLTAEEASTIKNHLIEKIEIEKIVKETKKDITNENTEYIADS